MAGHFHYRGVHSGFEPRAPRGPHLSLYLLGLLLLAAVAFFWMQRPPTDSLLPAAMSDSQP